MSHCSRSAHLSHVFSNYSVHDSPPVPAAQHERHAVHAVGQSGHPHTDACGARTPRRRTRKRGYCNAMRLVPAARSERGALHYQPSFLNPTPTGQSPNRPGHTPLRRD